MADAVMRTSRSHSREPLGPRTTWVESGLEELARARGRSPSRPFHDVFDAHDEWDDEHRIRLIFEDYCDRRARGEATSAAALIAAFPQYRDELTFLLDLDDLVAAPALPEVGETLGEFELIAPVGRGASGRVFLARETGLAGRLVVVKVQPGDQDEHLSLAQVQNTHIIPLLSARAVPERGLRVLCMPDLGGASLDWVLADLAAIPVAERNGRNIVEALHRAADARPETLHTDGACHQFLAAETWERACCWIAACLADGLDAAHRRGLVHMDLKPSNVLIAADGLPLLLDFHLARPPIDAGDRTSGRIGGTPGWMSPEQAEAIDAARRGEPCTRAVDRRCDIYALGQILATLLAGGRDPCGPAWAATGRPPRALRSIVDRCLATAPEDRYASAAEVADDLRRFLANLPLGGGRRRRTRLDAWGESRRRSRWGARLCAIAVVLLAVGIPLGALVRERLARVDDAIRSASRQLGLGEDALAIESCLLARELAPPWIGPDREEAIRAICQDAGLARQARDLHARLTSLRGRPPGESAPAGLPSGFEALIAWSIRRGEPARSLVRSDLIALVAEVVARDPSRTDLLARAKAALGPGPVIEYLEAGATGRGPGAPVRIGDASPAERLILGRLLRERGRPAEARDALRVLVRERPDDLWARYELALCALQLEEYPEAEAAFRVCEALAPQSAGCSFNRGLASEKLGRQREAIDAYSRAIDLDGSLHAARLHRGLLNLQMSMPERAVADFEAILADAKAGADLRARAADALSRIASRPMRLPR